MLFFLGFCFSLINAGENAETWTNNEILLKSYRAFVSVVNWTEAKAECHRRSAKLAVILNTEENNYIGGITPIYQPTGQYWIGLVRGNMTCACFNEGTNDCQACRESWRWDDGTSMGFYIWANKRPLSDENRACGIQDKNHHWDATSCSNKRRFVCQYDCEGAGCKITDCEFREDSYECTCAEGYTGPRCDQDIDECASDPCGMGGTCVNGIATYICDCSIGYTGLNCETDIDYCKLEATPCYNGGTCVDGETNFDCQCAPGYTGPHCKEDYDECSSNPCMGNGNCTQEINIFYCNCFDGYTGETCDVNLNTESTSSDQSAVGIWYAFYVGSTFLAVAFVCMLIVIAIYIKTSPNRQESHANLNQNDSVETESYHEEN